MPDYQRDITLTGGSNDYFVAPGDYDYWLYNPPTNSSVTISRAGKAPLLISAGEVFVIHLGKGEEIALSGTAGNTISILDHSDVKLIPAAKEILGTVKIGDGTNVLLLYATNAAIPSNASNFKIAIGVPSGSNIPVSFVANSVVNANEQLAGTPITKETQGAVSPGGDVGPAVMVFSQDGNGFWQPLGPTSTIGVNATLVAGTQVQTGIGKGASLQAGGSATGPAANANITGNTTGVSLVGNYMVWATASIALGAIAAGDEANMGVYQNAVKLTTLGYTANFGGPFGPFFVNAAANDTFSVRVIANATAGVVYTATVWAVPVP